MMGNIISAKSGHVLIRIAHGSQAHIGDIYKVKDNESTYFVKVVDLFLQSNIPPQFIEDIAGNKLEGTEMKMFDGSERLYKIARAKILRTMSGNNYYAPRNIPNFFSEVEMVEKKDLEFLKRNEVPIGELRTGKESLSLEVSLPAEKLISHHMLVVAATGKGKSNFAKVFLKGLGELDGFSSIVFDPHSEYYGRKGMKGLSSTSNVLLVTPQWNIFPGSEPLKIHSSDLFPSDFSGISNLSGPQREAMSLFYKEFEKEWINALLMHDIDELFDRFEEKIQKMTLTALRRKINFVMELDGEEGIVFTLRKRKGTSLFERVRSAIEREKTIIIDTSLVGDEAERLIASSLTNREFYRYRRAKQKDPELFSKLPELMILFEEAPRFLGKNVGANIFERIAREGRKFKTGLCAITQMPCLIPREILSQMNTKVILGLPSPADREAVINSSSQNISDESLEIQMLDRGEAIITSPFLEFPLPAKIYYFDDLIKNKQKGLELGF